MSLIRTVPIPVFLPILVGLYQIAIPAHAGEAQGKTILEARGYVVPFRQITVSPKVAGHVIQWLVDEWQDVKEGEILARLDPKEAEINLKIAQAEVAVAQARTNKATSGPPFDQQIAAAELARAKARLELARVQLDGTTIRAPFAGTVLAKRADVGSIVDPAGFNVPAGLCDLAGPGREVAVAVSERDLTKVSVRQACLFSPEAFPDRKIKGRVLQLAPLADRATGTVTVRIRPHAVAGQLESLRPGMAVVVRFLENE
jgi:multidrug efflux pump subunit AcrA (membrane-fusion protein)